MGVSLKSRLLALGFSLYPPYFGTGARITYVAQNWREVHIKLPLSMRTRNYVGTVFGGSMYAAVDPIYMVMLIKNLGSSYVVWDKAASIRFKKPGRSTLFAHFVLEEDEVRAIEATLTQARSIDRVYQVNLTDAQGTVHATVEKIIHIRRKTAEETVTADAPR